MAERVLPKEFESKPEAPRDRKPAPDGKDTQRDWRENVRFGDEAPSGTFRIPRF